MAIAFANITTGFDTAGLSTASTASISPVANRLYLAAFVARTNISADTNTPTLSGCGITWVAVANIAWDTSSTSRKKLTLFRGLSASPTSGALTVDYGGQAQTQHDWIVDEVSDIDTGGTSGSNAVVQSATNKNETVDTATLTATLAAFSSLSNATYGVFTTDTTVGVTVGSGFTQLATVTDAQVSALRLMSEYKLTNDTTVDFTPGNSCMKGGIAIEIKQNTGANFFQVL